jgi:hypothetical protein
VYLAVVPLAVAPIVLWRLLRAVTRRAERGRRSPHSSSRRTRSALVVAAFTSTPWGYDRLTTATPSTSLLWLIVLVVWLAGRPAAPLVATATGSAWRSCSPPSSRSTSSRTEAVSTRFLARSGWVEGRVAGRVPLGEPLLAAFVIALFAIAVLSRAT